MFRTIEWTDSGVRMIDQTKLPREEFYVTCRTYEEVAEAILLVGLVCRSTGHVRVGIGASRQDVNVSVRGGRRVEIKGVPQAGWAPRLVHGEAVRQVNLLRLRDELLHRGFSRPADLGVEGADVTDIFARSPLAMLRRRLKEELSGGDACLELLVQLQAPGKNMPIMAPP